MMTPWLRNSGAVKVAHLKFVPFFFFFLANPGSQNTNCPARLSKETLPVSLGQNPTVAIPKTDRYLPSNRDSS